MAAKGIQFPWWRDGGTISTNLDVIWEMSNSMVGAIPFDVTAVLKGSAIAIATFVALGTVTALWENPLFFRMTPAGPWEISLLALQSMLLGAFFSIRRSACAGKPAGAGSVLAFIGVACPVCNKILLYVFGAELLLVYFEPVRVYVAALGVVITAFALWWKWQSPAVVLLAEPAEEGQTH